MQLLQSTPLQFLHNKKLPLFHLMSFKRRGTGSTTLRKRRNAHHAKVKDGKQHHPQSGMRTAAPPNWSDGEKVTLPRKEEGKATPPFSLLHFALFCFNFKSFTINFVDSIKSIQNAKNILKTKTEQVLYCFVAWRRVVWRGAAKRGEAWCVVLCFVCVICAC